MINAAKITKLLTTQPPAERFFGTTFRPSLVTVHELIKNGGLSLLKMAADSSCVHLSIGIRIFMEEKRTNELHTAERRGKHVCQSNRCYSSSTTVKKDHVATKVVPKYVDNHSRR